MGGLAQYLAHSKCVLIIIFLLLLIVHPPLNLKDKTVACTIQVLCSKVVIYFRYSQPFSPKGGRVVWREC